MEQEEFQGYEDKLAESKEAAMKRRHLLLQSVVMVLLMWVSLSAWAGEDILLPHEPARPAEPQGGFRIPRTSGVAFWDDAVITGGFYSIYRNRVRYDMETKKYKPNLDHLSFQYGLDFTSGYIGGLIGIALGVYGSFDGRTKQGVDHEMNFFPWNTPYKPNYTKRHTVDDISFYKAHVQLAAGNFWGKLGYFQPSGPGVLGVNWSFFPGTYRGGEIGATWKKWAVAFSFADQYKAPWFREMYGFRQKDRTTSVPWLGSVGVRYTPVEGATTEIAYGMSQNFLHNWHVKLAYEHTFHEQTTVRLGYHWYAMADTAHERGSRDVFAGLAWQQYLYARLDYAQWQWMLEGTWTRAPQSNEEQLGYFAYRLTIPSGSSRGAYDVWWDARSDWNADGEVALYASMSRGFDDILPWKGVRMGLGYVFGFDGKAFGTARHLKESAWTADIGYTYSGSGWLQGAWVKAHYTHYNNHTSANSWSPYKNVFQDERDCKLMMGIPFSL